MKKIDIISKVNSISNLYKLRGSNSCVDTFSICHRDNIDSGKVTKHTKSKGNIDSHICNIM
jgi:hypothetical protein